MLFVLFEKQELIKLLQNNEFTKRAQNKAMYRIKDKLNKFYTEKYCILVKYYWQERF